MTDKALAASADPSPDTLLKQAILGARASAETGHAASAGRRSAKSRRSPAHTARIALTADGECRREPSTAAAASSIGAYQQATLWPGESVLSGGRSARQRAVAGALAQLLGAGTDVTTSNVLVIEVKEKGCDDSGYNGQPRLSQGACAVTGYLARAQGLVRTRAVEKAGTAVGLAARLGASDADFDRDCATVLADLERLRTWTSEDPADRRFLLLDLRISGDVIAPYQQEIIRVNS